MSENKEELQPWFRFNVRGHGMWGSELVQAPTLDAAWPEALRRFPASKGWEVSYDDDPQAVPNPTIPQRHWTCPTCHQPAKREIAEGGGIIWSAPDA